MVDALGKLYKGAEKAVHQLVLVRNQVVELQAANKATTRQKLHERKRVQKEETLAVKDGI
jgi:hypothetical protein